MRELMREMSRELSREYQHKCTAADNHRARGNGKCGAMGAIEGNNFSHMALSQANPTKVLTAQRRHLLTGAVKPAAACQNSIGS